MDKTITIIIDDITYSFNLDDVKAMREIPSTHRAHLVSLLEILKAQHERSTTFSFRDNLAPKHHHLIANKASTKKPSVDGGFGKGDVDHIMARLIAEERANQKPSLQASTIYKWLAGIVVVIFILILI